MKAKASRQSKSVQEHKGQMMVTPEWIRLPAPGFSDPHTGLKRSKLNELILPSPVNNNKPPVKSLCLQNKSQKRGVRLISYDSLMGYLRGIETEQSTSISTTP